MLNCNNITLYVKVTQRLVSERAAAYGRGGHANIAVIATGTRLCWMRYVLEALDVFSSDMANVLT